jgi:hypothetical protein
MSHDNSPTYSELLAKKLKLIDSIQSAPLDGAAAYDTFTAKMELLLIVKAMKSLEASMPF